MDENTLTLIIDALPFPVVFVDVNHTIQFLNKTAKFHYYEEMGYSHLIGKSIFDCHHEKSKEKIIKVFERLKGHGREVFLGVSEKNERIYMVPVRNDKGELIGYFERYEGNFQK